MVNFNNIAVANINGNSNGVKPTFSSISVLHKYKLVKPNKDFIPVRFTPDRTPFTTC